MDLWPFAPDSAQTEAVEWMSDVLGSRSSEQRVSIRNTPRQYLYPRYILGQQQFSLAKELVRKNYGRELLVPVWHDLVTVGNLTSGQTSVTADAGQIDLAVGDSVVLWESDTKHAVRAVDGIVAGSVILNAAIGQNLSRALLIPVRVARFAAYATFNRGSHEWTELECAFQYQAPRDLSSNIYPLSYNSIPVITDRSFVFGTFEESLGRDVEVVDFGIGKWSQHDAQTVSQISTQMNWFCRDRSKLWAVRRFLHLCKGRQRSFWLPSYNNDLKLAATLGSASTTLTTDSIALTAPFFIQINRWSGANIQRYVSAGGPTSWTLDSATGVALTVADVESISIMKLMRFDADRVEIQHRTARQADISVPVIEIPIAVSAATAPPVSNNVTVDSVIVTVNGEAVTLTL